MSIEAALRAENAELRERIVQLEEAFGLTARFPALGLTPYEERLLGLLVQRPFVGREAALTVLYGDKLDAPEPKQMDVWIYRLRRRLRQHGIEILTIWGRGLALDQDSRARVAAVLLGGAPA